MRVQDNRKVWNVNLNLGLFQFRNNIRSPLTFAPRTVPAPGCGKHGLSARRNARSLTMLCECCLR
jgi:hypothetical protein